MGNKLRSHDSAFKAKVALEAIKGEKTLSQISSECGIHPNQITKQKRNLLVLHQLTKNKELRNQLFLDARNIFNKVKKRKKRNDFYYDFLYTICLMGIATLDEEREFKGRYQKKGWKLPDKWKTRYTWWNQDAMS